MVAPLALRPLASPGRQRAPVGQSAAGRLGQGRRHARLLDRKRLAFSLGARAPLVGLSPLGASPQVREVQGRRVGRRARRVQRAQRQAIGLPRQLRGRPTRRLLTPCQPLLLAHRQTGPAPTSGRSSRLELARLLLRGLQLPVVARGRPFRRWLVGGHLFDQLRARRPPLVPTDFLESRPFRLASHRAGQRRLAGRLLSAPQLVAVVARVGVRVAVVVVRVRVGVGVRVVARMVPVVMRVVVVRMRVRVRVRVARRPHLRLLSSISRQ